MKTFSTMSDRRNTFRNYGMTDVELLDYMLKREARKRGKPDAKAIRRERPRWHGKY